MSKKYIIARMPVAGEDSMAAVLTDERKPVEFTLFRRDEPAEIGSIYVGKVEKVADSLQAAFVMTAPEQRVYLPLDNLEGAVFKTRKKDPRLKAGDELLVQVQKEAVKSKLPRATAELKIPGRYMVLFCGSASLCFSKRLSSREKERLRALLPWKNTDCGVILRTNAGEASREELLEEFERLSEILRRIREQGPSRTCFSCLWRGTPSWLRELERVPAGQLEEVVTDDPAVYETLLAHPEENPSSHPPSIRLYRDSLLPLYKLYSLEALLDRLTKEHVWMGSGGFLVIQQTEAFVSVDVNSGRYQGKKDPEETAWLINREAAGEIAAQIRLRQLSGIILVDFINMKDPARKKALVEEFRALTKEDPVKTTVVDMTPLDILEVTREKGRRSLAEQLASFRKGEKKEAELFD